MVWTIAISCVSDYASGCLHKSKIVHERGKRNQTQIACYIYFSGKGQMVAKSNNIGLQCLRNVGVWRMIIEICRNLIVKIDWYLTVVGVWQFISNPFLLACFMLFASILLPVYFVLPVVYFVVEFASMCWWLIITCWFATEQLCFSFRCSYIQIGNFKLNPDCFSNKVIDWPSKETPRSEA